MAMLVDTRDLKSLENLRWHSQRIYSPPPCWRGARICSPLRNPLCEAKMIRPEYSNCSPTVSLETAYDRPV